MKFAHSEIPNIVNRFHEIKSDVIVVGGGRWASIITKELIKNFPNIKNIFIVTKNKKIIQNFTINESKKIIHYLNFRFLKYFDIKYAIIANKNKDHYQTIKKLLPKNISLLVEKPPVVKETQYHSLKKIIKKYKSRFFVSMPFYYSYYFYLLKKNFLKNTVFQIKFNWYDKINEIRNGVTKKQDFSINYLEDTIYHFYSILNCLFDKKKTTIKKFKNLTNEGFLEFEYGKHQVLLNCLRSKKNTRVREILFNSSKQKYSIDFSNDNNLNFTNNGLKKKLKFNFCQKTLKFQLFYFMYFKNYRKKKLFNEIGNLDNVFKIISKIKK